jgi:2-C-methyl-D-erythritol 4-phosphate cytidylyltransferase
MTPFAVIVAGGSGLRLGAEMPKQFLPIAGEAMIVQTAKIFTSAVPGITLVIALPETYLSFGESLLNRAGVKCRCVTGGIERYHSVKNALQVIPAIEGLVAVHDAARPFATPSLIHRCFDEAAINGSAIPVVPVKDRSAADRDQFRAVQTPQVFDLYKLKKAYESGYQNAFTDDASVYESAGFPLHFTHGEEQNFKITTSLDFEVAEWLAKQLQITNH